MSSCCESFPCYEEPLKPGNLKPKEARELIQEYFKMKRGYISAAIFLVMYLMLIAFLENVMHVEVRAAQGRALTTIQPASTTTTTYTDQTFWTSIVTAALIGGGKTKKQKAGKNVTTIIDVAPDDTDYYAITTIDKYCRQTYDVCNQQTLDTSTEDCKRVCFNPEYEAYKANPTASQWYTSKVLCYVEPVTNQTVCTPKATKATALLGYQWENQGDNITTRGYNHDSGHVIGGIRLTVQNKESKACTFEGVGLARKGCTETAVSESTEDLVLSNGLNISYDDQHDGYSVFLSTAYPRENLTSIAGFLNDGGFFNQSRFKISYSTHVFYPMGSTLVSITAEFKDDGTGAFIPNPVWPSWGAKLMIYNTLQNTFKDYGWGTVAFVISVVLWFIHLVMFFRELYYHRHDWLASCKTASLLEKHNAQCTTDAINGSWLDCMFHQPHSSGKATGEEEKGAEGEKKKETNNPEVTNGADAEGEEKKDVNSAAEEEKTKAEEKRKAEEKEERKAKILKAWSELDEKYYKEIRTPQKMDQSSQQLFELRNLDAGKPTYLSWCCRTKM